MSLIRMTLTLAAVAIALPGCRVSGLVFNCSTDTGPNDVYAGSPVYHSTGNGTWALYPTLNAMNDVLAGMWAASPNQIFASATAQDGVSSPIIWIYQ